MRIIIIVIDNSYHRYPPSNGRTSDTETQPPPFKHKTLHAIVACSVTFMQVELLHLKTRTQERWQ